MKKKISFAYKCIKASVRFFYPKTAVYGEENLPEGPCVIVGNHAQANGPIACELYFPGEHVTWTVAEMMDRKTVPAYAYQDFWSKKPEGVRWFYKMVAHLIGPLSECVFQNADTIPVYRDRRIFETFQKSVEAMKEGARVIIFPEEYEEHNNVVHEFQHGFVDLAKRYFRENGEEISFVPLYVCPALKRLVIGKPIRYDHEAKIKDEQVRICEYLMNEISEIAYGLPRHRVVPYPNISKKEYPENIRPEGMGKTLPDEAAETIQK